MDSPPWTRRLDRSPRVEGPGIATVRRGEQATVVSTRRDIPLRVVLAAMGVLLGTATACGQSSPPEPGHRDSRLVHGITPGSDPQPSVLRVRGRHLYDACGEKVVLRGVNKMIYWTDLDGIPSCSEIAKTGANAVRITWLMDGTADELDTAITNCAAAHLLVMVDLHDATIGDATARGGWDMLPELVDYWTREDVLEVIRKHQRYLMINVGNEVGGSAVTPDEFRTGYEQAVRNMRTAGIHAPLVIDGSGWGKDIDVLQSEGPSLVEADPDHNLIFSVHMWWPKMWGYDAQSVIDELQESVEEGLPLIVGEFGNKWQDTRPPEQGEIPYLTILEQTYLQEIGMFAWSWGPGNQPQYWLDMTSDGYFSGLQGWGLEVAVTHPFSILNTARRPRSIVLGSCDRVRRPTGRRIPGD